jgi:hypothetical protein
LCTVLWEKNQTSSTTATTAMNCQATLRQVRLRQRAAAFERSTLTPRCTVDVQRIGIG